MSTEVSTVGGDQSVEGLRRELAEAREQQAATAEILRVISSSPTDLQRVFAEIAASAARLCDAYDAAIRKMDGNVLRLVAHHGPLPIASTIPLSRSSLLGCAVIERRTIHVADMQAEGDEYPESRNRALQLGHRTTLGVPLIRAGRAVGVILIRRTEVCPFTERQIDLLKTFADQAVIAIENTRLFEAEQASKRELQESLQQQTATADVLKVISRAAFDLPTVLDTLAQSAARLSEADLNVIFLRDGNVYRIAARYGMPPVLEEYARQHPISPGRNTVTGRVALESRVVHIPDVLADPEYSYGAQPLGGYRALIGVPLLREGSCIGVMAICRRTPQRFTTKQIELATTFADQAVIAIENVRLFEAEQARTRELTEALEQQTATADVLKVISRAALDLQRVLDALVESAARLCNANDAAIYQVFGDGLRLVAHQGQIPFLARSDSTRDLLCVGAL